MDSDLIDSYDSGLKGTLFSILTASYDKAGYLEDWARSIISQSYRPIEVIFVDDVSTDDTQNYIKSISEKFKSNGISYKIIKNRDKLHCASSYLMAHKNANGQYYGVVDSDDALEEGAVDFIVSIYDRYPDIGWIYTQFMQCDKNLVPNKNGFCFCPPEGETLLSLGERGKHCFSHWRTFSNRISSPYDIWKPGMKCAVDKHMGYKLEELGRGMFADRVCYLYRQGADNSVSRVRNTKKQWRKMVVKIKTRRKSENISPYPIVLLL